MKVPPPESPVTNLAGVGPVQCGDEIEAPEVFAGADADVGLRDGGFAPGFSMTSAVADHDDGIVYGWAGGADDQGWQGWVGGDAEEEEIGSGVVEIGDRFFGFGDGKIRDAVEDEWAAADMRGGEDPVIAEINGAGAADLADVVPAGDGCGRPAGGPVGDIIVGGRVGLAGVLADFDGGGGMKQSGKNEDG